MLSVNDQIVCIKEFSVDGNGVRIVGERKLPKLKNKYTIDGFDVFNGELYLFLKEINDFIGNLRISYRAINFRRLNDDFADSILSDITEQIKEEQSIKINQ
jgi:hypothetical protein